jgi:thiol-disulfide isomerase/thioredoxin
LVAKKETFFLLNRFHREIKIQNICAVFPNICAVFLNVCAVFPNICAVFPNICADFFNVCAVFSNVCAVFPNICADFFNVCTDFSDEVVNLGNRVVNLLNGVVNLLNGVVNLGDGVVNLGDGVVDFPKVQVDFPVGIVLVFQWKTVFIELLPSKVGYVKYGTPVWLKKAESVSLGTFLKKKIMDKHIKLFYLKNCPFCKQAFSFIDELKQQDAYRGIEIETIEESEEPETANRYDYYYVPTFYVDGVKVSEGAVTLEKVEAIFNQ